MAGATQRRKIFPHVGDETSSGAAAKSGNDKARDPSYDNAKSSKTRRRSSKGKGKGKENKSGGGSSNGVAQPRGAAPAPSDHLLPLPLVVVVLLCSGLFWMSSFRDVMATGKPVLDTMGKLWGQEDADLNLLVGIIKKWLVSTRSQVWLGMIETSSETQLWERLGWRRLLRRPSHALTFLLLSIKRKNFSNTPSRQTGSTTRKAGGRSRADSRQFHP